MRGVFFLCLYQYLSLIVLVWIFHYGNFQTYSKVEGMVWHLGYLSLKFNHYHTWSEFHFIITLLPFLLCVSKSLLIYRVPWVFFFWYFVYYRSWVICSMLFHLLDFVARPWHWSWCPLCPAFYVNGLDPRLCQLLFFPFCKNISWVAVALPTASHLETRCIWSILSLCDIKVH